MELFFFFFPFAYGISENANYFHFRKYVYRPLLNPNPYTEKDLTCIYLIHEYPYIFLVPMFKKRNQNTVLLAFSLPIILIHLEFVTPVKKLIAL